MPVDVLEPPVETTQTTNDGPSFVPANQELTPQPAADSAESMQRPRDENGRFASTAEPQKSKFSTPLLDAARQVYLTDDEINSFPNSSLLLDAVRGRAAAQRHYQPEPQNIIQQSPPQPPTQTSLPDFTLTLDENLDPDLAKPIKELHGSLNQLKNSLFKEVETLRAENARLIGAVQQSAVGAQEVSMEQQAVIWDQLAAKVPGMIEAIGKPSVARRMNGSPQARGWTEVAPHIRAAADLQNVPEQYVDWETAIHDGWVAHQAIKQRRQPNGAIMPGQAARSSPRQSPNSTPDADLTPAQDYERRLAAMEAAFRQSGGNPFAL